MAEGHTIETYGRGSYNRNIWPYNSQAAPSRLADSFVWLSGCTLPTTIVCIVCIDIYYEIIPTNNHINILMDFVFRTGLKVKCYAMQVINESYASIEE